MRAPQKFLDADKLEINPAYVEYYRARQEDRFEGAMAFYGNGTRETYVPEDYDKRLPEGGAWIRVLISPHTALPFDVPVLSMWFAVEAEHTGQGKLMGRSPYKIKILTPGGDLCLWPHEYQLVEDIKPWIGQEPDCMMHTLDGGSPVDPDQLFYLESRGISQQDATLLLIDQVKSQRFAWFEMAQEYIDILGGVGTPLWYHMANNPRETSETSP